KTAASQLDEVVRSRPWLFGQSPPARKAGGFPLCAAALPQNPLQRTELITSHNSGSEKNPAA
ncbi:MAG: hypothetical protein AABM67_19455, partial [Acidobacteriota bacterium]